MVLLQHMQIGEVAERTGLSLRTIRYYEQIGLVRPSSRTPGGFRLYTEPDVARLNLIKRMKPMEFSLEETRDLLAALDALDSTALSTADRDAQLDRLAMFRVAAEERCKMLRQQLESAEEFATDLRKEISRQRRLTGQPQ